MNPAPVHQTLSDQILYSIIWQRLFKTSIQYLSHPLPPEALELEMQGIVPGTCPMASRSSASELWLGLYLPPQPPSPFLYTDGKTEQSA